MVIGDYHRHSQVTLGGLCGLFLTALLGYPHSRLCNTVEIDVVLPDELINSRVLTAPVVAPLVPVVTCFFEVGLGEGDRRPEGFRPHPYGELFSAALKVGSRHAPFNVSGETEGHQLLACAEAYAVLCQYAACLLAVGETLKANGEGGLFRLLDIFVSGQGSRQFLVFLLEFPLDVNYRGL